MGDEAAADEARVLELLRTLPDEDVARLTAGPTVMLTGVVAYAPSAATRLRLRMGGARVVGTPEAAGVTHAVLPRGALADGTAARVRQQLSRSMGEGDPYAHLVSEEWLHACEATAARAEERPHELREALGLAPELL